MPYVDSVAGSLTDQALTSERTHTIRYGEDLTSIGKHYGVTPDVINTANPQLTNPNRLYPGEVLLIPGPSQSATVEEQPFPIGEGAPSVKYTSNTQGPPTEDGRTTVQPTSERSFLISGDGVTVGRRGATTTETVTAETEDGEATRMHRIATNGSVNVNPNAGTVSLSGGLEFSQDVKNARGYGVSFGISSNATATAGMKTEDGTTTYQASTDVSITLKGGVSVPRAGATVGHTEGIKSSFVVSMPVAAARRASIASVNPFDPSSMPEGTVIKLDGSHYTRNEFKLTFRELAVQTKVTNASGVSVAVEKTGESTVRVTAGPTEAIEAYNGIGVDFGKVSFMLGRNDKLSHATLKTAEFDLSTRAGQAKYNDFLATGQMPEQQSTGVSEVATIEKRDFDSQTRLNATLGPLKLSIGGARNTGNSVVTTQPDGTMSETFELQYSGNVPMTIKQTWDAGGNEVVSAREYSYTINAGNNNTILLNVALTGNWDIGENGPVPEGQTVAISFTESQMRELMRVTQDSVRSAEYGNSSLTLLAGYDDVSRRFITETPADFALSLARNLGGDDWGIANHLFSISDAADGASDGRFSYKINASVALLE